MNEAALLKEGPDRREIVLVGFALVLFLFIGLGGYDLAAPDEPRFALVAHEMMTEGHWLLPHRNDRPYPDKPPLFFWGIAAFSYLLGGEVSSWSARLPSAFAALAVLAMLARWAHTRFSYAILATPLVLASAFRFFFQAHMAQIDMLLCLCTTGALILGYQAMSGGKRRMGTMGLLLGLGILAKGPVGYLIPMGGLALFAVFSGRKSWRTYPWSAFGWGLLPPLLWLGALAVVVWQRGEFDYLRNLLYDQTLVRFFNPWHHYRPPWYYLVSLFHDFFPWSPLLLVAIPFTREARAALSDKQRFCWGVVLFVIVFFSLSKGKRNLYILPLYPFAAYLVTTYLEQALRSRPPGWGVRMIWAVPALVLAVVGAAFLGLSFGWIDLPVDAALLETFPARWAGVTGGLLVFWNLAALIHLKSQEPTWFPPILVGSMLCIAVFLYGGGMPWAESMRSTRPFMASVEQQLSPSDEEPVLAMVDFRSGYRFYGKRPVVELATAEVTRKDAKLAGLTDLPTFWQQHPEGWVIVRQRHLTQYTERDPTLAVEIVLSQKIGSKNRFLLVRLQKQ